MIEEIEIMDLKDNLKLFGKIYQFINRHTDCIIFIEKSSLILFPFGCRYRLDFTIPKIG